MLSMGAGLRAQDFKNVLNSPSTILIGLISQMILLPLLALVILTPLQLAPEIFIGFIILSLSPGGTSSNMFSYLAKGNLALSISLTAVVSVIAPFSIPLLAGLILATQLDSSVAIKLPFLITVAKLVVVTLVPLLLGMIIRRFYSKFYDTYEFWITRIPLMMLLLVIVGIINQNWDKMPFFIEQSGIPALLLAVLAMLSGYLFARLCRRTESDARTIAIETSIQNGGTAILVTGTILQNPALTVAPVMYGILMLIPMFLYLAYLNRFKPEYAT